MAINMCNVKKLVEEHYSKALENVQMIKKALTEDSQAISDVVPGYKSKQLEFGQFLQDNFTVLFIDMRNSTKRAQTIGPEKTFLSLHAFIPAMIYIIEYYQGHVIDIMGDGVMAFFGGGSSGMAHSVAIQKAGLCAIDMIRALKEVVNPVIKANVKWEIQCGIGIDHGDVIVTKIGTNGAFDVKAIGDCINKASKLSSGTDNIIVTKKIRDKWPTGKNGKIGFKAVRIKDLDGYALSKS